jgi:hypothetical protein
MIPTYIKFHKYKFLLHRQNIDQIILKNPSQNSTCKHAMMQKSDTVLSLDTILKVAEVFNKQKNEPPFKSRHSLMTWQASSFM